MLKIIQLVYNMYSACVVPLLACSAHVPLVQWYPSAACGPAPVEQTQKKQGVSCLAHRTDYSLVFSGLSARVDVRFWVPHTYIHTYSDILFLVLAACVSCVKDMSSSFAIWVRPHTEDCGNPLRVLVYMWTYLPQILAALLCCSKCRGVWWSALTLWYVP